MDMPTVEELSREVPPKYQEVFRQIVALTDPFGDEHLDGEYKALCREMAVEVCQGGSPVLKGKVAGWACAVVNCVGWVNFLGDASQKPHMKSEQIAKGFGVSPATMAAKSKVIREGLRLMRMDPNWTLPSRLADNPLVWLVQLEGGLIADVRMLPRHVQEEAYRRGLIPFIPAGRPKHGNIEE